MSIGDWFLDLFWPPKTEKASSPKAQHGSEREQAIRHMQASGQNLVTPERTELIRKAMEVHRAKQTILADLKDEDRQKLVAIAIKKLLNEKPQK